MLRSFICLLLAILSLSHYINCADNDTQNPPEVALATYVDSWVSHDFRERGPISLLWHSSDLDYLFYYLVYDSRKDYCEVTQVATRNANGAKITCQLKFPASDKDIKINKLTVQDEKDEIGIAYSTADTRARNSHYVSVLDFKKCGKSHAPEGPDATASSPAQADEKREEVKTEDETLQSTSKSKSVTSKAKHLHANCQLNDKGTQLTCTQKDWHDKVLMDNVQFELPSGWKADWWAVHNANAGAIVVYFASCPHEYCLGYAALRLTAKGVTEGPFTNQGMHLDCHDMSEMKVDFSDHSGGWTCMHAVCPEPLYRKNSETLVETNIRYRQHCMKGDVVN